MMPEEFCKQLVQYGWRLTDFQLAQFAQYFELLVSWNKKMNLTTLTNQSDVYLKHFYDSVAPALYGTVRDEDIRLLDVGAGAGFPSLPMKILCPRLCVTIIDSLQKRLNFLSALIESLQLTNVTLLHGRAEDFGQLATYRGQFDIVTARAVARMNILSELTLPFLKKNGQFVALKATQIDEEMLEAKTAIATLGAKSEKQIDYNLPDGSERHLILISKTKETPKKYPRQAGIPAKRPIGYKLISL